MEPVASLRKWLMRFHCFLPNCSEPRAARPPPQRRFPPRRLGSNRRNVSSRSRARTQYLGSLLVSPVWVNPWRLWITQWNRPGAFRTTFPPLCNSSISANRSIITDTQNRSVGSKSSASVYVFHRDSFNVYARMRRPRVANTSVRVNK